jgi:hypothetical protein
MLPASDLFKAALLDSHRAMTHAVLMSPDVGAGFTDTAVLSVASGSLTLDGTRNVWRSGQLSLVPTESVDRDTLAVIDSTSRLRLERGIRFPDGTEEWVTIALVQAQDIAITLSKAQALLAVADLGSLVEDFKVTTPYVPQAVGGAWLTTVEAIQDLVTTSIAWDTIPGWDVDASIDTAISPIASTVFTGSRWTAIQTLGKSIGAITYAKPDGRWAIRSTVIDMDAPVATFATGAGGVMVDVTVKSTRANQYNAYPLRWESPSIGGLVFIVDDDPLSPTYWDGPFGRRPRDVQTNDLITSEEQAIAAGTAALDEYRGRASSISFTSVHNPLLEPLDVIVVDTILGRETHVIDSIAYPLTGGTMTCQTRLLRVEA